MIEFRVKIIFIIGVIISIISYSFYKSIGHIIPNFYYKGISIAFCCYTYCFFRVVKEYWYYLPLITYYLCINKVLDEFFGDAEKIEISDYIFALITCVLVILNKKLTKLIKND